MKKLSLCTFLIIVATCGLVSCGSKSQKAENAQTSDTLKLSYAEGFSIRYFNNYKEVIVYSPWIKGAEYARYYLVTDLKIKTPSDGTRIKIPLQTLASTSVTHLEFLSLMGELPTITGVCSPSIIYNPTILKRVGEGKIADLGDAFSINVERTLQLNPGAVMMSGYNQNDPYAKRVSQAGIPVIFNNEWMETSLLARAEWIKFVGVFYNKEKLADSIFSTVDKRYNEIKAKAATVKVKPAIMAGSNFRGTWYMPAGHSFMGRLFADAGARYYFSTDTTSGSLPLNVETVLKNFSQSDVWLNCSFSSLSDLIKADSKHSLFRPVVLKQVYNFNKRKLPSTANDFWESAVARPDLLLSDVIAILHPEILPGYQLVYAEKLK
ncbi:MAG: ABC transporter substrate-binding protein [Paludibacter sp.]|nr:ABC transporter substrate-binding protein [Paludibacter sp.]